MEAVKLNKPDFLVIGAARSGTTWLYHRLKMHKNIFVPPVKEIHFFDIQHVLPVYHWVRVRRYILHVRKFFEYLLDWDKVNDEPKIWLLGWGLRYFLYPKTINWYGRLFLDKRNRISGELTPAYALLSEKELKTLKDINPDQKLNFQKREPIHPDRTQTVNHHKLHKRQGDYSLYKDEIRRVIFRKEVLDRSNYLKTINLWESVFSEKNFCYLFYDEIRDDPSKLLTRLFEFLQVGHSETALNDSVSAKVGSRDTGGRGIPEDIERELAIHFLPMVRDLELRFKEEYPGAWRKRLEAIVDA
ncbi:MAG: hypothetical protein HKN34_02850 [Gammaproteobacteria bacterium]|nr:hypothetical protein [Gammaproteobacteria bacterium]